jgi:Zn-dependent protease with chaperone function
MDEHLSNIYRAFDGKLIGTMHMKVQVCETRFRMPPDIVEKVTGSCWFLSSMKDAWAFAFTGNDLKDMHLIFLSDELLAQDEAQIRWTVAHEIGHVILNHRNSTLVQQSKAEIAKQEAEADRFAQAYT